MPSPHPPQSLVLMGTRRSGKSAIHSVVFKNTVPDDTLFALPTPPAPPSGAIPAATAATGAAVAAPAAAAAALAAAGSSSATVASGAPHNTAAFLGFTVVDSPGANFEFYYDPTLQEKYARLFARAVSVVFVVDAQDDTLVSLRQLFLTVNAAFKANSNILFDVFIHKVDGLSDDHKIETQRDIQHRIREELIESGLEDVHVGFHLTSIYDHSVFEAFSKVVQRILGAEDVLPTLENLLNVLCSNSGIEKAFLFDTSTKIYVATDSSPVDVQSYELCADMMDVVIDISAVYGNMGTASPSTNATNRENSANRQQIQQHDHVGSVIKLNNSMVLYMRAVDESLSLVCLLREENFEKCGLIDFNFGVFRDAVVEVFAVRRQRQKVAMSG